ncbi:branched-chain amino acid ABC transporter permease [Phreatobacter aquaticus]|uniref:Branched-chain amino acid ABC transporter permease n=1 Tax=Phreatobacter aquaticus TaxID=2570229 RepID=A0A4D7QQD2_9HYPH|nr:branched-chain amino acid ABC transporter permease [Phreatobacter aquaticus]QCK86332.1 branched-chain amino acid ABC transporter permease [Phreatobacter aquaticus]
MTMPSVETNAASPRPASRSPLPLAAVVIACALGLGLLVPVLVSSQLALTLMTQAVISAVLATGIGFMIRQNGLTSFGHAAFYGLAAYGVALNGKFGLMPTELAIILAIVLPSILAFVAGLGIVRLPPLAFSMLTLAVAQSFHEIFLRWRDLANGDDGMAVRLPSTLFGMDIAVFQQPATMFVVCWIVLVLIIGGLWLIARSRFGLLTIAIRENEERARYIGFETVVPRAIIYGVSAAVGAIGGVLFVLYNAFVTPGVLHWSLSGEALVMAVIGGARAIWGPALGSVIFFMFKDAAGDLTEHWPAIIGVTLIVVTVLLPHGVSGLLSSMVAKLKGKAR